MSNDLLLVLPLLQRDISNDCVVTMQMKDSALGVGPDEILLVDNSIDGDWVSHYGYNYYRDPEGHNLGVARAWNIGARKVLESNMDYLVCMSAAMRFGPALHTTWRRQMETFWGSNVIECDGHSWHLIAFHRRVFEMVGLFDENFYPAYEEAIDFGYRMRHFGLEKAWPHVWVNALSAGAAMHNEMVSCPNPPLVEYYKEKWGGIKGFETFQLPWGSKPIDYFPKKSIPELAELYGLETWW